MRGWIYRNVTFSFPTIFGGGDYIVTLYFHRLTIFSEGVIISWHYIFTPGNIWWGGDYIMTLYLHPWQYLVRGWLYRDIIFSLLAIFGEGVIISWHYIFIPDNIWSGGDYIVTLYFHPWQYLVRGWLYRDIIFSLLAIFGEGWLYHDIIFSPLIKFGEGVIISWHNIFTPDNIWSGDDYIVTLYFHSWQYLVRGWLYRDIIFSFLTIFGQGVIISWHYIFTPDSIWSGGDYIMTLYFHSWQYLVRGWLYHDIIFSPLIKFGEGVIKSWHNIFTPDDIWWGDDYIVTLYFHSWQYLVRGWLYRDIHVFSLMKIFGEGVIISWHYNIISDTTIESGTGGDYIWIFSLSKFDSAMIPGFYHSYPYIHPMKLKGLKWLYFSMIPSLLLKLSVLVDMSMDFINSLWWTKICKKS